MNSSSNQFRGQSGALDVAELELAICGAARRQIFDFQHYTSALIKRNSEFFSIRSDELQKCDEAELALLELAREALEDAGEAAFRGEEAQVGFCADILGENESSELPEGSLLRECRASMNSVVLGSLTMHITDLALHV
jgi:hypothetical protein